MRLRRGFLCFSPPNELPPVIESPAEIAGHLTFGSFNNVAKISRSAYTAWVEILKRVPHSHLRFKYGKSFGSKWMQEQVRSRFASAGIDTRRLEFLPAMPTLSEHLSAIGGVDVALDSFPYHGTMTTLETLTMSVPVIALRGQTYSRRASSAMLTRLGADELVATRWNNTSTWPSPSRAILIACGSCVKSCGRGFLTAKSATCQLTPQNSKRRIVVYGKSGAT
ncbi:MAG: hypothetical protein WD049_05450 [Candidatus Paceibacterota bacterium]